MTARMNRQIYCTLAKRFDEADLGSVPDGRGIHGRKWPLESLLRAVVGGMVAGKQSLAEVEVMSANLTAPVRRLLGARRRVPDTTMRDALVRIEPGDARRLLRSLVRAAQRRKALTTDGLPFGVVSFDGKHFDIPSVDDWYAQRQTASEGAPLVGMVRTVTVALTSSRARPIIEVVPIPAPTNEMGIFPAALDAYCAAYSGLELAKLVTYDAGACSAHNATEVRARGLHYLFGLKGTQPTLYADAQRWLGSRSVVEANATTSDRERGLSVVRRLYLGEVTVVLDGWEHLRTVLRVESEAVEMDGTIVRHEDRYFVSSLPASRLSPEQWLLVVRRHWGVETARPTSSPTPLRAVGPGGRGSLLDVALVEDARPWIEANPRGALVIAILRRIAYTILTLFRSVTQRSDERRDVPWKTLLGEIFLAFMTLTIEQLRPRTPLVPAPD